MKRFLFTLLIIIGLVGFAFATGGAEQDGSQDTVMGPQDPDSDDSVLRAGLPAIPGNDVAIEMITSISGDAEQYVQTFLEEVVGLYYPNVTVEYQPGGSAELAQVINTRIAGGNPPDLALVSASYYVADWVQAGAIRTMSDYWDEYNLSDVVPAGIQNTYRFDGEFYGVPVGVGAANLYFWNSNVLNAANTPLPPYETWDDFFAAGETFAENSDMPFYVEGYTPAWFGMAKTLMLAASRFNIDLTARILNGEGTARDFRNILEFHKEVIDRTANEDYVSVNAISGVMEVVGRSDGATAFGGTWGYPRFVNNNLVQGEEWDMGRLPGEDVFTFVPLGMFSFDNTGNEDVADAVALTAVLKTTQITLNVPRGSAPSRTDVDSATFPDEGRAPAALVVMDRLSQATSVPRAVAGLPAIVHQEFPAPFSGYISGSMSLDEAVQQILDIQERHQDRYVIDWTF